MTTTISTRRASGFAAIYLAVALIAAMLYFLVGTNMPSVTDPAEQVQLLIDHQLGLHLMYLVAYVAFGIVLAVLVLGLYDRLAGFAPATARVASAVGLIWAGVLVASGMVFIVGMNSVIDLHTTDPAGAVVAWQAIYPVTLGLGGAGGEVLGGTWLLLVSLVALRGHVLPTWLTWVGLVAGAAGLVSTVPGLASVAVVFGLLVIVWLVGLGVALLREHPADAASTPAAPLVSTGLIGTGLMSPGLIETER
jgi:hypothetical protein